MNYLSGLFPDSVRKPILTKSQNYKHWQAGDFGNRLRSWRSIEEWKGSGFSGLVALRTLIEGGGPCFYNVLPSQVEDRISSLIERGVSQDRIMINEAAPEQNVILQGEYLNDLVFTENCHRNGYFYYSQERLHMRDALKKQSKNVQGILAERLISEAMTPSSYEDWKVLLDMYPGHVFEVSVYDKCLGDIPDRNALVWEVRMY